MRLEKRTRNVFLRATWLCVLAIATAIPVCRTGAQAPMTCQLGSGADAASCNVFHYHIQMYNPEQKTRVELTGVNEFATLAGCDAALAKEQTENATVVRFMTENDPREKFQPDLFGPCHCDMTHAASSPNKLTPERRVAELRKREEINAQTRELLLDAKADPTSAVVTGLANGPTSFDPALWPKIVFPPDPAEMKVDAEPIPETDSMETTAAVNLARGEFGSGLDLELVDVPVPEDVMVSAAIAPTWSDEERGYEQTSPVGQTGSNPADAFVSFESARVQEILQESGGIDDARIFESAMQRLQVLSNLKVIVLAAGTSSTLANAFDVLDTDEQRKALVGRLFGGTIESHWILSEASDVIVEIPSELTVDPVAVLRESTGRYDDEQRKQALYYLLGRTANLTPSQELWIANLMSSFL